MTNFCVQTAYLEWSTVQNPKGKGQDKTAEQFVLVASIITPRFVISDAGTG